MRLFTVGLVSMTEEVRAAREGADSVPYFRTQEFSEMMLESDAYLRAFAHAEEGTRTVYLTASGTAAMEAVVLNAFTKEDRLLIVNGGTFGERFVRIAEIHGIPHDVVVLPYGETLCLEHFVPFTKKYTALLVNIDETSTGQPYDMGMLSALCREKGMYLVVDAISSFLCDPLDMAKAGVDALITSSQKGACISPGLSMVLLRERFLRERVETSSYASLYFDFKSYLKDFTRGQTPFTPAVGVCVELHAALHAIAQKGLDAHLARIAAVAQDFRARIRTLPVSIPSFPLSNALTPVLFDRPIAYRVFEVLKDTYDVMVNPTGGALHDRAIRVAHIGNTTEEDNAMLVSCLEKAICDVEGR